MNMYMLPPPPTPTHTQNSIFTSTSHALLPVTIDYMYFDLDPVPIVFPAHALVLYKRLGCPQSTNRAEKNTMKGKGKGKEGRRGGRERREGKEERRRRGKEEGGREEGGREKRKEKGRRNPTIIFCPPLVLCKALLH